MATLATKKQKQVYEFIKEFQKENGYPPTLQEICNNFGFSSTKSADSHIQALIRKGYLQRNKRLSRSLNIVGNEKKPTNGRDLVNTLRKSGFIGMWKNRVDIGDSSKFARKLREQAQKRERNL